MSFDPTALQQQVPYYLAADPKSGEFLRALQALMEGTRRGYYASSVSDEFREDMLQGDGWTGLQLFAFDTGNRRSVRGMILSNSCDIDPANARIWRPKVSFVPTVKLTRLEAVFQAAGATPDQVASRLREIRAQRITSMFYLPADGPVNDEYVALLEDVHSMPADAFDRTGSKIFTLTMAAFYLFVFKLSVHFCRLQENVSRLVA